MTNTAFLETAEKLKPVLYRHIKECRFDSVALRQGETFCADMGEHLVGYVTLTLGVTGQHPDAPAWLQLRFAERRCELDEKAEDYHGWISPAWIQQEQLHVDVLPTTIRLPRRYAFRYLQIEALAGSDHWKVTVERIDCETVSSADWTVLPAYKTEDAELQRLDKIACKTLHDCMQQVFEDGPKRDRRLWLGDLRLQALANYETFRQYDLVKRCLYLFAGRHCRTGRLAPGCSLRRAYRWTWRRCLTILFCSSPRYWIISTPPKTQAHCASCGRLLWNKSGWQAGGLTSKTLYGMAWC